MTAEPAFAVDALAEFVLAANAADLPGSAAMLLRRITVRPDAALTDRYPQATPVRIVVTLRDGRRVSRGQDDFHGAPSRPFSWERTVAKFDRLAQRYADPGLRAALVDTVAELDHGSVSALTELLTAVGPRSADADHA